MEIALTLGLLMALVACALFDLRTRRLPDWMTLPLGAVGILNAWCAGVPAVSWNLFGAAIGFLSFYTVARAYLRARNEHGLGLGDAKLLGAAGAWLGPLFLAPIVLVAALLALSYAGLQSVFGRAVSLRSTVPFGPFLSAGFFGCWCLKLAGWSF